MVFHAVGVTQDADPDFTAGTGVFSVGGSRHGTYCAVRTSLDDSEHEGWHDYIPCGSTVTRLHGQNADRDGKRNDADRRFRAAPVTPLRSCPTAASREQANLILALIRTELLRAGALTAADLGAGITANNGP
jgi:hypothetical protein